MLNFKFVCLFERDYKISFRRIFCFIPEIQNIILFTKHDDEISDTLYDVSETNFMNGGTISS